MELTKISELRAGASAAVRGEIFRISEARGSFVYFIRDETGGVEIISDGEFAPHEVIIAIGKVRDQFVPRDKWSICAKRKLEQSGALQILASKIKSVDKAQAARVSDEIKKSIDARAQPLETKFMIEDAVTKKIESELREAARVVRGAVLTARPILLRHHGDADGIAGALALSESIGALFRGENFSADTRYSLFRAQQNSSAVYEKEDALKDINTMRIVGGKPLVILVDFGANEESRGALETLKSAEFETIIIDHHPTKLDAGKFVSRCISPWNFEGGSSDYAAGFLACELAKKIGNVDAREIELLEKASLIGDKSRLISDKEAGDKEKKCALVLDFAGAHKTFQHTLEFYGKVLGSERLFNLLYSQATERIESTNKLAKENVKITDTAGGIRVCLVRLDATAKKGEFPSRGKICGKIHDDVSEETGAPLVTIGYGRRNISIRANQLAIERGFSANRLIAHIKEELTNALESGGGHDGAASMKLNEGFGKIVRDEVLKYIGEIKK